MNLLEAYPQVAEIWDYEKNGDRPEDYTFGSAKKKHFICNKCEHKWNSVIADVALSFRRGKNGCSGCSVRARIKNICGNRYGQIVITRQYWEFIKGRTVKFCDGICDCCNRQQSGERLLAAGFNPATKKVQGQYAVCLDCVEFAESDCI